ncbi:MAG: hypothetical protein V4712_17685 [Pseudomonadota bacterium]
MEPRYIRQLAKWPGMTGEDAFAWFREAQADAHAEGCTFFRYSVDDADRVLLIEGWEVQPEDQGAPRFSFIASTEGAT